MNEDAYDRLDDAWSVAIKAATVSLIVGGGSIGLLAGPAWLIPWATGAIGFGSGLVLSLIYVSRGIAGEAEDLVTDKVDEGDRSRGYS